MALQREEARVLLPEPGWPAMPRRRREEEGEEEEEAERASCRKWGRRGLGRVGGEVAVAMRKVRLQRKVRPTLQIDGAGEG
jgi:hypothetical protein